LVSHGRKVNSFGLPRADVFSLIVNSGLLPLCNMFYEVADKDLLCGFVERWHRDTNTFYMPFGEMKITPVNKTYKIDNRIQCGGGAIRCTNCEPETPSSSCQSEITFDNRMITNCTSFGCQM